MSTAQNLQVYKLTEQNLLGVNYEIDATVDEIVAYYEAQMPANGWKKTTSYSNEKMLGIYYQKDRRVAMVFITQSGSQLMVTIQIAES
jgi:hypothetical protein